MQVVTPQKRAEEAASAVLAADPLATDKVEAIEALGANLDVAGVEKILGTGEFTNVVCSHCGRAVDQTVRLIGSFQLCVDCLNVARLLVSEVKDADPTTD